MLPHHNPLPKPEIISTPPFEQILADLKSDILAYLSEHAPEKVAGVTETLENESELLTKLLEAFAVIFQSRTRQLNSQAQQMFGMYATDNDMVDLIVSQLGISRQIVEPGDPNAHPSIPPEMESNDSVLTRYYLAAYALASTGTRSGYRFHAMTLGGRPTVKVESTKPQRVAVTYEFNEHEFGGLTKDAQARRVAPGEVDCYILAHSGDGVPSPELINATQAYLERDDIAQETDLVTVKLPVIRRWACHADLYIRPGPDTEVVRRTAEQAVEHYAAEQHRLGGSIEPSMLIAVLLSTGAHRCDLSAPNAPIRCLYNEAPYLESIEITVAVEGV
ncbi:baseplate J/gp47 family protein [Pseudoalteromonas rubra]|uniref:baseplate J/gp47 family protein n=1 Tax=Pseudoalteromonas rubra TaxID=43658 RepID=UPI000F788106|nr:baseplate J/gp47 family protein [Pseudoalteromonas rubra]